jgi:hypothetical protein
MQAVPVTEEGKMLGDALSTVKIQVQQMKRHLVRCYRLYNAWIFSAFLGIGSTYGRTEERQCDAWGIAHLFSIAKTVL